MLDFGGATTGESFGRSVGRRTLIVISDRRRPTLPSGVRNATAATTSDRTGLATRRNSRRAGPIDVGGQALFGGSGKKPEVRSTYSR